MRASALLAVLVLAALGTFVLRGRRGGQEIPPTPAGQVTPEQPVAPSASGSPVVARPTAPEDLAPVAPSVGLVQRGRVVDVTGVPVPGLPVVISGNQTGLGGPLVDGGRFLARSVTDADGRFELTAPRPETFWVGPLSSSELPPILAAPTRVAFSEAGERPPLVFEARAASTIAGRVQLAGSNALPGRETRIAAVGERTGHSVHTSIDAAGRFELRPIGDENYFLYAATPDLVAVGAHGVAPGSKDTVLTLVPVQRLDVSVAGGAPEGLRMEVVRAEGHVTDRARMLLSGRSPQFLRPGAYIVSAFTADQFGYAGIDELGPPDQARKLEIALGPAATLGVDNRREEPCVVLVEHGGTVVRAMSVIAATRLVLTIPAGRSTVTEYTLDGSLRASHTIDVDAGGQVEVAVGA